MKKAYFFDMDGVLFDSMPYHARAWVDTMNANGFPFTERDAFLNEGRTGQSVIREAAQAAHRILSEEEVWSIYREKTDRFHAMGEPRTIPGVMDVLHWIQSQADTQIFIVTGSGQRSLFDRIDQFFPGIFQRERMVTAYDVQIGKPDPEPYLKAWEKSGLSKDECCVIENAPLGARAGIAAGLDTYVVNTGPLDRSVFEAEGATRIFDNMSELLGYLKDENDDTRQ